MGSSLNVWVLIWEATLPVKLVMLILVASSVTSWVMIIQRWMVLGAADSGLSSFERRFWSGMDLSQLFREGSNAQKENRHMGGMELIFRGGFKEFMRLRQQGGIDSEVIMNGAQRAMRVAYSREEEKLEKNLTFLATVGSVTPYIGLFGTVIGIMNSFISLAGQSQASLQVVAPGIAEALIATAMGLFAAIPAVVAYNRYSSRVESITSNYLTFMEEFSSILHRQLYSSPSK
ncbi:MAG: protein TolQ [Pseudohongiellaceae bacterium]|nr:protein TolQ [Pseudohongiellaceae bacterium]